MTRTLVKSLAIGTLIFAAVPGLATESILSQTAYGKITFGMQLNDAEKALSEKAPATQVGEEDACRHVKFKALPGASFMVEKRIITRADLTAEIPNALHVAVGDALADVRKAHPAVRVRPNKYDPNGHDLVFKSPDGKNAIVMEETGGKIASIRAGVEPSVEYVEGCL